MALPVDSSLPSRRTLGIGLLGGFTSLALVSGLWFWFGFTTRLEGNELFLLYNTIGAVLLGFVPTVFLMTRRLVAPLVTILGLGAVSAYLTWSTYVAPDVASNPVDPTPFGWYLLGWVGVLAFSLLTGWGEQRLRRASSKRDEPTVLD